MSITFYAGPDDLGQVFAQALSIPALVVLECYSVPGSDLRRFASSHDAVAALLTGSRQFCLWSPRIMPEPHVARVDLGSGRERLTAQGCGLFWLNAGLIVGNTITASHLSWFTESGARAKCSVTPGPDSVDWAVHKTLANHLQGVVRRKLRVASVPGRAILREALSKYEAGWQLKEHIGATRSITVGAGAT
jgi:hypothetical protein